MRRESFNLRLLFSAIILSTVWALNTFQKTGDIMYSPKSSHRNTVFLEIRDCWWQCKSTGDPNTLVPVTILPIDDDEIKLEWNPRELMEVQDADERKYLEHSLYANIDKHVLSGLDEMEVGIIIQVPKDRLVEIQVSGGYQVNILKGFTRTFEEISLSQASVDFDNRTQYSSPKVNADFTSLPGSSYIQTVKVYNARLVLKTSVPVHFLEVSSIVTPTSVEIQGNIKGNLDRSWEPTGGIHINGPDATVLVDGYVDVSSLWIDSAELFVTREISFSDEIRARNHRSGQSVVHAGGIIKNSQIRLDLKSDVTYFTIMVPNCTNIDFEYWYYSSPDSVPPGECLEKAGPQVSVDFLNLESLSSSSENHIHPPHKTRWEIIAPVIAICAVILIVCGIFTHRRVKGRNGRVPDSSRKENNAERAELGDAEPQ